MRAPHWFAATTVPLLVVATALPLLAPGAASGTAAVSRRCHPNFEVVAHRGARHSHDENTVPAVVAAARRGDSVEVDVRATSDGRALVIHDATFNRTTTGTGRVGETTLRQARTYRTRPDGEVPPTLKEVLLAARPYDVDVYVEVKTVARGLLGTVARNIRRARMLNSALVTSFNRRMTRVAPHIDLQWKPRGAPPTAKQVRRRGVQSLGITPAQMSRRLVHNVLRSGVEVHSRLVSSRKAWRQITDLGARGALTNRGNRLRKWCRG